MSSDDYIDVYRRYLNRFEELFGDLDFEEPVQHGGQLVKKLRYDEFVAKWTEFKRIEEYLREVMTKGATLNDEVNRTYRELSAAVLERPKDFMIL
ncbi:MAG: hypothetical protein JRI55_26815 [Deltaproteobacteria bacterium]|jgi:hypothetical protein|nr:hypothetical protein [Deltaproteobacteria bacterium]